MWLSQSETFFAAAYILYLNRTIGVIDMLEQYWNMLSEKEIHRAMMMWKCKEEALEEYLDVVNDYHSTVESFCEVWPLYEFINDCYEGTYE